MRSSQAAGPRRRRGGVGFGCTTRTLTPPGPDPQIAVGVRAPRASVRPSLGRGEVGVPGGRPRVKSRTPSEAWRCRAATVASRTPRGPAVTPLHRSPRRLPAPQCGSGPPPEDHGRATATIASPRPSRNRRVASVTPHRISCLGTNFRLRLAQVNRRSDFLGISVRSDDLGGVAWSPPQSSCKNCRQPAIRCC